MSFSFWGRKSGSLIVVAIEKKCVVVERVDILEVSVEIVYL